MIYLDMLRTFARPHGGVHRSWASHQLVTGFADMIYAVGFAMIAYLLTHGKGDAPVGVGTVAVMAAVFGVTAALALSKWIGAWRLFRRPRTT